MEAPHISWENRWFPVIFPLSQSIESHICHQTIYLFEIVFGILYQQKHSIKLLMLGDVEYQLSFYASIRVVYG